MANMGQDIKEAMTGGSVAVVGKNTILSENIVDKQIGLNKISDDLFQTIDICKTTSLEINTGLYENEAYRGWANGFKPLGFSFNKIKYTSNIEADVVLTCELRASDLSVLYSTSTSVTSGDNKKIVFDFGQDVLLLSLIHI